MNCMILFSEADKAGKAAVAATKVTPMIVGEAKGLLSNEIDYSKKTYFVEDGVCGFASVNVKPGNSKFAKFLKEMGMARRDSYNGGVSMSVHEYNQSLQKKEAYAYAFAKVLREAGVNARVESRMD